MLRRKAAAVLCAVAFAAIPTAAVADDGPVTCPSGHVWSRVEGTCVISVASPRTPPGPRTGKPRTPTALGKKPASSGTPSTQKCVSKVTGKEMPCRQDSSWWSNSWNCYVELADPQPPKSDLSWEGHSTGAIYTCYDPAIVGTRMYMRWSGSSPAGPAAPPDPRVLAQEAVALMGLRAIRIGIVPEDRPGRVGVIGLPTWMWVEGPGQNSWGPISRTASAGGYSVTATGSVERVVWRMGDGSTVVCRTPGTAYADSFGKRSSPDCGHAYTRQGTYTVRATSYWLVRWSGIGQSGSIPLSFTQTTVITMGEVQVLTQ
jgi:hypothetical protein